MIRGGILQRLIAWVTWQKVLYCSRCGWRGRARLARTADAEKSSHRRSRRRRHVSDTALAPPVSDVDLDALDRALGSDPPKGL